MSTRGLIIGIFFLLLALINYENLPADIRLTTTLLAILVSFSFFVLSALHKFNNYAPAYANRWSFFELSILQADGMAFLILTQDIMNGFGVFVMIISAGIFFTTTPWVLASIIMLSASWIFVLWSNDIAALLIREGLLLITSVVFCFLFYYLRVRTARRLSTYQLQQDAYRTQLEQAIQEIETLSGLLPICAKCKNIKDEQGQWHQIEAYVTEHSQAEFSHSICPSCFTAIYPGYDYDKSPENS